MNLFLFDLDDTLIPNQHDYSHAILDFARYVIDTLGNRAPDPQTIINLQASIDDQGVELKGWGHHRFPESMVQTYRRICKSINVAPGPEEEQAVYQIGMSAFDQRRWARQGLLEGAAATLDFLCERDECLKLVTKGDPSIQLEKVKVHDLTRWFRSYDIHVVENKSGQVLTDIMAGYPTQHTWHVGNSIRSDVIPAVQAQIGMIYVPCETWQHERNHNGIPDYERLLTLKTLAELPAHYENLP